MLGSFLTRYLPIVIIISTTSCQPEEDKRVRRADEVITTVTDERDVKVRKNIFGENTDQFRGKKKRRNRFIKVEHEGEVYYLDEKEIQIQMNSLEKHFEENPEDMALLRDKLEEQVKDGKQDLVVVKTQSDTRKFVYNKIEAGHGRGIKLLLGLIIGVAVTILVNFLIIMLIISFGGPFFVFVL